MKTIEQIIEDNQIRIELSLMAIAECEKISKGLEITINNLTDESTTNKIH